MVGVSYILNKIAKEQKFMGYRISCKTNFDAAHFLSNHSGHCSNIHGHRWNVIAKIYRKELEETGSSRGMVIDFGEVKPCLKEIAGRFDHKLIYEKDTMSAAILLMLKEEKFELAEVGFRPTAENFAKYFYDELKSMDIPVSSVEVYETPDNCAEYFED